MQAAVSEYDRLAKIIYKLKIISVIIILITIYYLLL